jgi:hypothetical protein
LAAAAALTDTAQWLAVTVDQAVAEQVLLHPDYPVQEAQEA